MTTALTDTNAADPAVVADPAAVVADPAAPVADPAAAEAAAVVADYEFAMPDDFDASQLKVDDIKAFAKDLGLDPVADKDKAQKILDRVIQQRKDFDTNEAKTKADVLAKWAEDAQNDKEIGGDKFDATLGAARAFLSNTELVAPAFKDFLETTGLGNHPEMIRMVARIAPHFASDTPVTGGGGNPKSDPLAGMYDNPTSQHS